MVICSIIYFPLSNPIHFQSHSIQGPILVRLVLNQPLGRCLSVCFDIPDTQYVAYSVCCKQGMFVFHFPLTRSQCQHRLCEPTATLFSVQLPSHPLIHFHSIVRVRSGNTVLRLYRQNIVHLQSGTSQHIWNALVRRRFVIGNR